MIWMKFVRKLSRAVKRFLMNCSILVVGGRGPRDGEFRIRCACVCVCSGIG